ncbi:MAG: SAM-dependent DNA methyltransferase [Anaerolineaceae bacterium]|nr:SAM-dependent DNA methyltransferase [Anaerolineaceae bacterium]
MDVVQKIWGFCNVLKHDGINYGDYIEQLTYLLFLKLAEEKGLSLPTGYDWPALREKSGTDLTDHYQATLRELGKQSGLLGDIFAGSLSRFREPVNLKRLIGLIDEIAWSELDVDLKGTIYEGLLQKFAAEQKGAGQYFTPRPLIRSICRVMLPDLHEAPDYAVHDPACGTGGFLIGAAEWMFRKYGAQLDRDVQKRMRRGTYSGCELVLETRRLGLMNLFLHEIEGNLHYGDSIAEPPHGQQYHIILTNPPFGVKGAGEVPNRDDFTVSTSNKQLNFIQHVIQVLKPGGRAAMVLPDNVLFEDNAGREVRQLLMKDCQLHTILRLPVGTFTPYSTGVKANVLFFRKGVPTSEVWVYDHRTNIPKITKGQPITETQFEDFVSVYGPLPTPRSNDRTESERFRRFTREEIAARNDNLDITWLKDESNGTNGAGVEPDEILSEIFTQLQTAMDALNELSEALSNRSAKTQGSDEEAE